MVQHMEIHTQHIFFNLLEDSSQCVVIEQLNSYLTYTTNMKKKKLNWKYKVVNQNQFQEGRTNYNLLA